MFSHSFALQVLRVMDNMWKKEGLDLRIRPYGCVCIGDRIGLWIEIVPNSQTIASIHGARKNISCRDSIVNWFKENTNTIDELNNSFKNVVHSCVGYCAATYVLGFGDRNLTDVMW